MANGDMEEVEKLTPPRKYKTNLKTCKEQEDNEEEITEKVIIPRRKVIFETEGRPVEIQNIDKNGKFSLIFLDLNTQISKANHQKTMTKFYNRQSAKALQLEDSKVQKGQFIVAKLKKKRKIVFIRAKVMKVNKLTKTAVIAGVDDFVKYKLKFSRLYKLTQEFAKKSRWMVKCRLARLECISPKNIIHEILQAYPLSLPMRGSVWFSGSFSNTKNIPLIELNNFIKDDEEQERCNVADHVLDNLFGFVSPLACLEEDKNLCEITHASKQGLVWLRFVSNEVLWNSLNRKLQKCKNYFKVLTERYPLANAILQFNQKDKLFLTSYQNPKTGKEEMRRALVKSYHQQNDEVKIQHVDFGKTVCISTSMIFPLDIFDESLSYIPHMALKVHLDGIKRMKAGTSKILSLIGKKHVIAKMVDEWPENTRPPDVRIMLRPEKQLLLEIFGEQLTRKDITFSEFTLSGLLAKKKLAVGREPMIHDNKE